MAIGEGIHFFRLLREMTQKSRYGAGLLGEVR